MRRVFFLCSLLLFLFSCKKEDNSIKEINFKELFNYMDKSPDFIYSEFKGTLIKDTIYTPNREIKYNLLTDEKDYRVVFDFYDGKSLDRFYIPIKESYRNKKSIISFMQKLSNRAYSVATMKEYHGEYVISSQIKGFRDRNEFWDSVSSKEFESLSEYWFLTNSNNIPIKFEIRLEFRDDMYALQIFGSKSTSTFD